jgi:hypothetical protein
LLGALLLRSGSVLAAEPATLRDLRAAYCARSLGNQAGALRELAAFFAGDPKWAKAEQLALNQLSETTSRHQRVLAYITPRFHYIDLGALRAAATQADADSERIERLQRAAGCLSEEASLKCLERDFRPPEIKAAQSACDDLSWMPF